jgi:DNA-binding CsgD family transcriptional regulator
MLLGRRDEQARVDALLADAWTAISGALVVRGEPGIGKSALLRYAAGRADGMTVLSATGIESESELPFLGLSELLHPVLGLLDEIPPPQAGALAGALAVGPPGAQDRFTICVATLSLLAAAAERRPVLAMIDDAHWLDASSREALVLAARRLHADRAVLLFAARDGEQATFEAPGVPQLTLQGVDRDACDRLLARCGASEVSAPVAERIWEATGGNPLAILEIPRVLSPAQLSGRQPLAEPLPAGPAIQRSFARRLAGTPRETQAALLVAAASQSGSAGEVRGACDTLGIGYVALEQAEDAGLINNDGLRIQFRHPLMRATVYHGASAPARRRAHRALADALADEPLASQRAWHLAAAADGADEQVAAALEDAAHEARGRRGHAAAASAFERAARLTPEPEDRSRRLFEAGGDAHLAGQPDWALRLLHEALTLARGETLQADIEQAVGRVEMYTRSPVAARQTLLAAADRIEPHDVARAALILVDVGFTWFHHGDPDYGSMGPALVIARRAYELGSKAGGVAQAVAGALLGMTLVIRGDADEGYPLLIQGEQALDETDSVWLAAQLLPCAVPFLWLEEYDRARRSLARVVAQARAQCAPGALVYPLCHLSEADLRMGRWAAAYANAAEAVQVATELGFTSDAGLVWALICLGWVEAGLGREQDCRKHVAAALEAFDPPSTTLAGYAQSVLGLLALGLGRSTEAVQRLVQVAQWCDREGAIEPAVLKFAPDLIEAYARSGARAEAEAALATFEALPARTRRTWARATAARCRGILAGRDFDEHFEEALRLHERTPTPFDRARTELCYGERLRRARRRAEARQLLHSALETFERLDAEPWVNRARGELRATGETPRRRDISGSDQLTLQELQVALKVAVGATNREVAAALFLSPKTIEAHLSRVYSKLGLRSRTELAHHFAHESGESGSP